MYSICSHVSVSDDPGHERRDEPDDVGQHVGEAPHRAGVVGRQVLSINLGKQEFEWLHCSFFTFLATMSLIL